MARLPPHWTIQKDKQGELKYVKNKLEDSKLIVYEAAEGESSMAYPRVSVQLEKIQDKTIYKVVYEPDKNSIEYLPDNFTSFKKAKEEAHIKAQEISNNVNTDTAKGVLVKVEKTQGMTAEEGEFNVGLVAKRHSIRNGERPDWVGTIDTNMVDGEYHQDAEVDLREIMSERMEIKVEYIPAEDYAQNYNKIIDFETVQ